MKDEDYLEFAKHNAALREKLAEVRGSLAGILTNAPQANWDGRLGLFVTRAEIVRLFRLLGGQVTGDTP